MHEIESQLMAIHKDLIDRDEPEQASFILAKLIRKIYFETENPFDNPHLLEAILLERKRFEEVIELHDEVYTSKLTHSSVNQFSQINTILLLELQDRGLTSGRSLLDSFVNEQRFQSRTNLERKLEKFFICMMTKADSIFSTENSLFLMLRLFCQEYHKLNMKIEFPLSYEDYKEKIEDVIEREILLYEKRKVLQGRSKMINTFLTLSAANYYFGQYEQRNYYLIKALNIQFEDNNLYWFTKYLETRLLKDLRGDSQ